MADQTGAKMYELARELFPICRSITGEGFRKTLRILKRELPGLKIRSVPTGTKAFDWKVPKEWNIRDAYILDPQGRKIVDFKKSNLHVVGYSIPVDKALELSALQKHLHSLPEQPAAIPYVTSYYKETWGFCLTHRQRQALKPGRYRVKIDSTLASGVLNYGELILPGKSASEVLISTYSCHPSLGNNEVSGPVVTAALGRWLSQFKNRRRTYRIVIIPETIGSIVYLSKNIERLKSRVIAGFNVTCVGDDRAYSYLPSRRGDTLADWAALKALTELAPRFKRYSFLDRGSDERQYCSPGVDLPVATIMRSKYGVYPEYHTSKDDLSLIGARGLSGAYNALKRALELVDAETVYQTVNPCEPQLSRHNLYPSLSIKGRYGNTRRLLNLLAHSDGKRGLEATAELIGAKLNDLKADAAALESAGLLARV